MEKILPRVGSRTRRIVGNRILQLIGLELERWTFFGAVGRDTLLSQFGWWDSALWLNLGVVAGSLLVQLGPLAGEGAAHG